MFGVGQAGQSRPRDIDYMVGITRGRNDTDFWRHPRLAPSIGERVVAQLEMKGDRSGDERSSTPSLRGLMAPGVMLPRFERGTGLRATRLIANTPIGTPHDATGFRILPSWSRWTASSISCAFPRPLLGRYRFGRR